MRFDLTTLKWFKKILTSRREHAKFSVNKIPALWSQIGDCNKLIALLKIAKRRYNKTGDSHELEKSLLSIYSVLLDREYINHTDKLKFEYEERITCNLADDINIKLTVGKPPLSPCPSESSEHQNSLPRADMDLH